MLTGSPHLYWQVGLKRSVPESVIAASLAQAAAVEDKGLASVLTLKHLAVRSGVPYRFLRELVARRTDPYLDIVLKRANGRRMRPISSPAPVLMQVQDWILRRILNQLETHPNSFAYTRNRSIKHCVTPHLGASWIVKLDIRNFFESIDERRVWRVFVDAGYQPLPAMEMARVCTRYAPAAKHIDRDIFRSNIYYGTIPAYNVPYMGFLPQGAPTSGSLANHVGRNLDERLVQLANAYGVFYTRYADDMTFSTSASFSRSRALSLIEAVRGVLANQRFELHDQKTVIQPPGARKLVLGLLVDGDHMRINTRMRRRIENHVRGVELFGLRQHCTHVRFSSLDGLVNHVDGLVAFWSDIDPRRAAGVKERWMAALTRDGWSAVAG